MINRILIVLGIVTLDCLVYFYIQPDWVKGADHSGLYDVLILQAIPIVDIILNFRVSLYFLGALGIYKKYREYIIIAIIIFCSFLSLHTAIIGTDQFGRICTYPSCIEQTENENLKTN